jgi:hypothetical protein
MLEIELVVELWDFEYCRVSEKVLDWVGMTAYLMALKWGETLVLM